MAATRSLTGNGNGNGVGGTTTTRNGTNGGDAVTHGGDGGAGGRQRRAPAVRPSRVSAGAAATPRPSPGTEETVSPRPAPTASSPPTPGSARLHRRLGELDRAEELLRVLAGEAGTDRWFESEVRDGATLELGRIAEERGDDATAVKRYETVPNDPESACLLAEAHLRAGRHRKAFDAVEHSQRHRFDVRDRRHERWGPDAPDLPAWWAWVVARIADREGRSADALWALEKARALPGTPGRQAAVRMAELAADARDALALHRALRSVGYGKDDLAATAQRLRGEHADLYARGAQLADEERRAARTRTRGIHTAEGDRIWLERARRAFDLAHRVREDKKRSGRAETVTVPAARRRRVERA